MIETLRGKPYDSLVPSVVPIAAFAPGLSIVDTSDKPEDRDDLLAKISQSQALILIYSPDEPDSLGRLRTFWLPFLRSIVGGERRPVVVASAKDDLRADLSDERTITALLGEYDEVETFLPVSSLEHRNVTEVFLYAVQGLAYSQLHVFVQGIEEESSRAS